MNENLNLVEILKDCPKGTKLYSTVYGDVEFDGIENGKEFPIWYVNSEGRVRSVTAQGLVFTHLGGDCTLFPSKEQRDWSKFEVKKPKFDPKTLQPFDKILMRDHSTEEWDIGYFSYIKYDLSSFDLIDCDEEGEFLIYTAGGANYWYAVPYNEETKHLIGTKEEAPEYYRYWED